MNDVMEDLLRWLRNPCAETASDIVVLAMNEIRRLRDDPNRSQCELGSKFAQVGRLRKEVERLRITDAEREALEWAIAVTCTLPHDPIGPIQRERLRDLARRHGRDA